VSVMTKLFIVLLIICSLLMTAATVVFVNRTEDFHKTATLAEERANRFQRDKEAAQRDADAARTRETEAIATANGKVSDLNGRIQQMSQDLAGKDAQVNDLNAKLAVANASITDQAGGLKTMGQNVADVNARNQALVAENDKLRVTNAEIVGANTDYSKRLDEAERERRFLNEQLNQARSELAKASGVLREKGIPLTPTRQTNLSMPDLKGVIRNVKTDEGRTYATISLGAQQKVEKGMEFSVIDQNEGTFLGKFIVDTVDPDSSFGRLEGPRVQNVRQDNLVLSRL
jgi:chromosome segregation ATPase